MCVGAIVRISPGHVVQSMIAFKSTILLNVLLPPIILNSGYQLKQVRRTLPSSLSHILRRVADWESEGLWGLNRRISFEISESF